MPASLNHGLNRFKPEGGLNLPTLLSSTIFALILPTEPENHDQTIYRVPVNGLIVILRFYG